MRFRLTPISMTLDDLELYKFEFSENFSGFRRFRMRQQLNEWRYTSTVCDNAISTSNWSNFLHAFALCGFVSDSWAFLFKYCMNEHWTYKLAEDKWVKDPPTDSSLSPDSEKNWLKIDWIYLLTSLALRNKSDRTNAVHKKRYCQCTFMPRSIGWTVMTSFLFDWTVVAELITSTKLTSFFVV